jgi:4-hydroxy 2-oxovalerate aldolase/long-chain acyl-CoA synthetase
MSLIENVSILDCTLRDGSYPIQFQFSDEDTSRLVQKLSKAGIEKIEVGHGLGLNAQTDNGVAAASDRAYIEAAASATDTADIGVFYIPGVGTVDDIRMAANAGADFIRIGTNVDDWAEMEDPIALATDLGLEVCANFMKSYSVDPSTLADAAVSVAEFGADAVYVVDSAGCMLPDEVRTYVSELVAALPETTVGFHCHDNLNFSVANSLAAAEAGAGLVDATLQGIGRSAGNTPLEVFATVLQKEGGASNLDQKYLMDIGQTEIDQLAGSKGIDPIDLTAGYARFHTKFLEMVYESAAKYDIDPRDLIIAVSEYDEIHSTQVEVDTIAEEIAQTSSGSALDSSTEYLTNSTTIQSLNGFSKSNSVDEFVERIRRDGMKYGKRSVLSLSMAFGDEDQPHPTVIHRGSQAVIGNIELTESHVEAVVEKASEIVDVVCIDVRLTEYDSRVTFDDDILWFDSRDAIARSLTHIVLHQNYSNVLIVGDNESVEAVESHFSWADIPIRTRHPDSIDDESIEWCDLLIGFTQTNIGTRVIERLDRDTTVIDAGLSSFSEDAIDSAMNRSIEMVRSDVRAGYISEISCTLITEELATRHMGRTEYEGVTVVAGGIIGDDGDVVVDSIETPTSIFGVADGNGGIKQEMSDVEQRHINTVRELLE